MGTVSSSLPTSTSNSISTGSSSSGSSSSSSNPTGIFTGTSAYSQDFQNLIERAVAIASLPISLLSNQQTTLTNQANELSTIDTKFQALQTALDGISDAMSGSSYNTTISDPKSVSAVVSDGAMEGYYSINVQDIGTYASALSTVAWDATADPSGNLSTYSLMINGTAHSFTPSDNSAATVASTINSLYGTMVNATEVNINTADAPQYKISLQSTSLGPTTLDIQNSSGTSLETQQEAGRQASYIIDNSGVPVLSSSRSVPITTGVNLTMLANSTGNVDVTVTRSSAALATAISTFADSYNAVVDELGKQRGQSAGPLQGLVIVNSLSQALSSVATYASGQTISTPEGVGLKLDTAGHLNYQPDLLLEAEYGNSAGIASFLGSATGGGFLKAATDMLSGLEAANTGLLKTSETDLQTQITNIGNTITTKQNTVSDLQTQLTNEMATADASIASMEQQYSYLNSMFAAMQTANQMYANG